MKKYLLQSTLQFTHDWLLFWTLQAWITAGYQMSTSISFCLENLVLKLYFHSFCVAGILGPPRFKIHYSYEAKRSELSKWLPQPLLWASASRPETRSPASHIRHTQLQSMHLPFLEAVNTVIKTKQRACAAPYDCQESAATCPPPPPTPSSSPPLQGKPGKENPFVWTAEL